MSIFEASTTPNLMITTLNTSTGSEIYYTDFSILYWFLGTLIVLDILILLKSYTRR